ncbi:unnamed protein product [Pedinophyceae sp. YPF-701]|nr:unnamed protein product [Pedinophyceae sp. YPF-701]
MGSLSREGATDGDEMPPAPDPVALKMFTSPGKPLVTVEEYFRKYIERENDRRRRQRTVIQPDTPAARRSAIMSEYFLKWGKLLYWCRRCYLLPACCCCARMRSVPPPPGLRVVVWMHEREYGRGTNTGCVLLLTLGEEYCRVLLRGVGEHDEVIEEVWNGRFDGEAATVGVLWPGGGVSPDEFKRIADVRSGGRAVLVALDATWGQARKLAGAVPSHVTKVSLTPEKAGVIGEGGEVVRSLLAPARQYKGSLADTGRICTAEAVAYALAEMYAAPDAGGACCPDVGATTRDAILENVRGKVDMVCAQSNRAAAHGTDWAEPRNQQWSREAKQVRAAGGEYSFGPGTDRPPEEIWEALVGPGGECQLEADPYAEKRMKVRETNRAEAERRKQERSKRP